MRYEFRPDLKKSGRNQVIGSWTETNCKAIDLPQTSDTLSELLTEGQKATSQYTHQQIVDWCYRICMRYINDDNPNELDKTIIIAEDVDCQWDLFLANTFSLKELQELDFSTVRLPTEWFVEWHRQLTDTEQDVPADRQQLHNINPNALP